MLPRFISRARFLSTGAYNDVFWSSLSRPAEFWDNEAKKLVWHKPYDAVFKKRSTNLHQWFPGGMFNICYNCLDVHVKNGYGSQTAIAYDSPMLGKCEDWSFDKTLQNVSKMARVLINLGVKKGDRVLIYMPAIPETVVAMLACVRIGAVHTVVFGGFAPNQLANRMSHCKPTVCLSASYGLEPGRLVAYKQMLDEAIAMSSHKPLFSIIYQRPGLGELSLNSPSKGGRDLLWQEAMSQATFHDAVPIASEEPAYLLYTSGTTGNPKGVMRCGPDYAVALHWSMSAVFNTKPGETFFATSDLGWTVGHSYIAYGPLLYRNTAVLYEGKPVKSPDPGQYFRVLAEHKVAVMFVTPTALRAVRREDPEVEYGRKYSLGHLRTVFVAGEHCDPQTLLWARNVAFRVPVFDQWWQTESGWPMASPCMGLEPFPRIEHVAIGSVGKPVPGYDVQVLKLDDEGIKIAAPFELGRIVVKCPMPPGFAATLWQNTAMFDELYFRRFPGYYDTMDAGYLDDNGNLFVMSREDDVINVSGVRLSSGAIEEACLENSALAECVVVGMEDSLKGHVPLGILVPEARVHESEEKIIENTVAIVRKTMGPVANFKRAVVVHQLPKTRSGKVPRKTLALMAAGKPFTIPVTIDDSTAYDHIYTAMKSIGLNPSRPSQS